MKEDILKKSMKYYPKETEEYWGQHRSGLLASSLSRRVYCKVHDINYYRFTYWLKKLSLREETAQSEKNSLLLPVHLTQIKPDALSTSLCTLNLKNGHHLVIHHERALSLLLEQWR